MFKALLSATRGPLCLAWIALAASLVGCPEQPIVGPPPCDDDFCLDKPPRIEIEPNSKVLSIVASEVEVGKSLTRPIRVINTGESALLVQKVTLQYTPPEGAVDGDTPALELVAPVFQMPTTVNIKDGPDFPQGVEFQIRFTRPNDAIQRTATLLIESNDPFARTETVTIRTENGAPSLLTQPDKVDFGLVTKGDVADTDVQLTNVGTRLLSVSGFKVDDVRFKIDGPGFSIGGSPDAPLTIDLTEAVTVPSGESRPITVSFISDSPSPADAVLTIYSDDPLHPDGFTLPLLANKNGPCILVAPRKVEFGGKLVGGQHVISVDVTSCGTEPLIISGIRVSDDSSPDFTVDYTPLPGAPEFGPSPAAPITVPVNDIVTVDVVFVPDEVNPKDAENQAIPDEGTLLIASNAFESQVEVPIQGAGTDAECPVAIIHVEEGEEVIPQTVLHLDGTQSFAPFGAVTNWDWSVQAPDGSVETFVPTATDPRPVFQANVVGAYTYTLRVRDASGTYSCESATYTVLVQPNEAIHIELTWNTPGDIDETDTGEAAGTDLDLHFTHPAATGPDLDGDGIGDPWFDADYDCFWHNVSPNWASFDPSAKDDPSLDRDDTDGGGPENLNLAVPELVTYRVGVHHWNDHDFGPVQATVKIFSYAALKYEVADITLNMRDMWCVAKATWLGTDLVVVNCNDDEGQKITPDYVNPFFFAE